MSTQIYTLEKLQNYGKNSSGISKLLFPKMASTAREFEPEVQHSGYGDQLPGSALQCHKSAYSLPGEFLLQKASHCINVSAIIPRSAGQSPAWDFNNPKAKLPTTLEQRFALAFERQLGFDVEFEIGTEDEQELIKAHKVIIGSASSVFADMFYEIEPPRRYRFPDCQPNAFRALIEYIYKREPVCMAVEETEDYFHVGMKFAVPKFLTGCKNSLISSISTKTVLDIYNIAENLHLGPAVLRPCMEWIEQHTMEVLELHLNDLLYSNFSEILKSNYLEVKEVELFKFLIRWAKAKCKKFDLPLNQANLRKVAQPLLNLIRLPKLPSQDFPNTLLLNFFSEEEILEKSDNLAETENQSGRHPRVPIKRVSSDTNLVVNREVGIHELIYALLPLERRKVLTQERLEKLCKFTKAFLKDTSMEREKIIEFLKKLFSDL